MKKYFKKIIFGLGLLSLFALGAGCLTGQKANQNNFSTTVSEADMADLRSLFAEKLGYNYAAMQIMIQQADETHVRGQVSDGRDQGGLFLASKVNGDWEAVFANNAMYNCTDVINYNFPPDMIKDCKTAEESITVEDAKTLQKIFAEQDSTSTDNVIVRIDQSDATHARGRVVVDNITDTFLALKNETGWEVVYRGRGRVACDTVREKDFPGDMIDDCFDLSKEVGIVFNRMRNGMTETFSDQYATDFDWYSTGHSISGVSKLSGLAMDTLLTDKICKQIQTFFYDQGFIGVSSDESGCSQGFQNGNLVCVFKPYTKTGGSQGATNALQVICGGLL